jgi:hypothetical protein
MLSDNQIKSLKFKTKCYNIATGFVVACALVAPAIYASYNKDFNQPEDKLAMVKYPTYTLAGVEEIKEVSLGQYKALNEVQLYLSHNQTVSKAEAFNAVYSKFIPQPFNQADVKYVLDVLYADMDWSNRAKNAAVFILDTNTLPLSQEELYIQLTGEYGFTVAEANYAISTIDYPAYLNMKRGL